MSVTVDPKSRKAIVHIQGLNRLIKAGVKDAAATSSRGLVRATSAEILRKPKGGRVYTYRPRLGPRRRHVASAPGETHANLSGKLRRSLGFKMSGSSQIEFGYGVTLGNAPVYAAAIEFGRRDGSIAPRPSLKNGIKSETRNFQANFTREINKRLGIKL